MTSPDRFVGVDVQTARRCAYAVIDEDANWVTSGWLERGEPSSVAAALRHVVDSQSSGKFGRPAIGIDAPRMALATPREFYWVGTSSRWRRRLPSELGNGRHCEVAVAAHRIANPQWTPMAPKAPRWMVLGFELFRALKDFPLLYEVFPSASYAQLSADDTLRLQICLKGFAAGPKDMLDAYVAAITVREFVAGRGEAVGGGDGYGEIALPRPLVSRIDPVLRWPLSSP